MLVLTNKVRLSFECARCGFVASVTLDGVDPESMPVCPHCSVCLDIDPLCEVSTGLEQ